ncbi:MarR family winged helix-turn-helix transcriptional regulator [Streptomyces ziwulingensis]|uniref:MarR family winged helix-turn-helix transcriptional regulator n=1 Tax=Streptomyces ziwulingensis TaxID=1045501 RepID=UPI003CD09B25
MPPNGPGDVPTRRPGADPQSVAREIADAVEGLTELWSLAAQQAALRLSPHQLRALRVLEAQPGLNLTAMAGRLEIGLPTASRLCDRLVAAGMLERELHPHDRREVRLSLTGQGRRVLREVAERRTRALASALAELDPGDRAALGRGLASLAATRRTRPARAPAADEG